MKSCKCLFFFLLLTSFATLASVYRVANVHFLSFSPFSYYLAGSLCANPPQVCLSPLLLPFFTLLRFDVKIRTLLYRIIREKKKKRSHFRFRVGRVRFCCCFYYVFHQMSDDYIDTYSFIVPTSTTANDDVHEAAPRVAEQRPGNDFLYGFCVCCKD